MRAEAQEHVDTNNAALALPRRFLDWDRAVRRLADIGGRVKVRLACAKTDYIFALGLERLGARVDRQRCGRGDLRRPA